MMRWPAPRERLPICGQDRFDPVVEGARHGLARELSLAIWQHIRADPGSLRGEEGEEIERARSRFHDIAARIAARGLAIAPVIGKQTGAAVDSDLDRFTTDGLELAMLPAPGRCTRVESGPDRFTIDGWDAGRLRAPGRRKRL